MPTPMETKAEELYLMRQTRHSAYITLHYRFIGFYPILQPRMVRLVSHTRLTSITLELYSGLAVDPRTRL
jgi:hypothetical protein